MSDVGLRRWFFGTFRADSVETDSISTEDVDIGSADFVESGDVLPVATWNTATSRQTSTSSTSFTGLYDFLSLAMTYDDLAPTNATLVWSVSCQANPSTDETASFRLYNDVDGEVVVPSTSTSAANDWVSSGWHEYAPSTLTDTVRLVFQGKTDPGNSNSQFRNGSAYAGIQL